MIDTVVYRGGDAMSGWIKVGVDLLAGQPAMAMLVGSVLALTWAGNAGLLARRYRRLEAEGTASRAHHDITASRAHHEGIASHAHD